MLGASSRHSRLRRTAAVVTGLAATAAYTFAVAPGVAHADSTAAATPTVTGITLSAAQVRRPINADGIGKWRTHAEALAPVAAWFESQGIAIA